jgi:S-adenosylmethionine:tRNA ribosyltransferase-isomerase
MVVDRRTGRIDHERVHDLPDLLAPGDLLILNDTRVLPARLRGRRERTGGRWEGLFLREVGGHWELLSQTRGRLVEGEWLRVEPTSPQETANDGFLRLRLVSRTAEGHWLVEPAELGSPEVLLQRFGHVPLPPYIRKGNAGHEDSSRYQTVYACRPGAVAAPTAGLHFTPELLSRLRVRKIQQANLTLHIGPGTFQPIQAQHVAEHRMHEERGELPAATVHAIEACRAGGGRVVAVGTTSVRVLETVAAAGPLRPWSGVTQLYIYPPFTFQLTDVLLTNFHLPRSSLLVLVSAFAGVELIHRAYTIAIEQGYRFYSYGDAMLIL